MYSLLIDFSSCHDFFILSDSGSLGFVAAWVYEVADQIHAKFHHGYAYQDLPNIWHCCGLWGGVRVYGLAAKKSLKSMSERKRTQRCIFFEDTRWSCKVLKSSPGNAFDKASHASSLPQRYRFFRKLPLQNSTHHLSRHSQAPIQRLTHPRKHANDANTAHDFPPSLVPWRGI